MRDLLKELLVACQYVCSNNCRIARHLIRIGAALALGVSAPALAQEYPAHPVKIIVPFPAGGTADVMPRIFSEWLARKWSQPVVIENRTGAGGNIGAEAVAKSEPDGYTLLAAPPPPLVINQNLYPKLGFDPAEFSPIAVMGRVPNGLVVNPKLHASSVAEVIAQAKANPGKLTSATQGNGTTSHLTSEMFQMMANIKLQNVPYRGSAPALTDLLAGSVDLMFDNLGVSLPLVKGGQLKLLAVATPQRLGSLPDVPSIAETLPGFESVTWFALVAPPRTPPAIVAKINADMNEALHEPEIRERLAQLSAEPMGGTVTATTAYMRAETERWRNVIKAANVKLE
ncbi:MAG: tripartite tricarboxylate transporter substrate binding protein [Alphaproteobacteria bacterium]|nr:MAG: tripartite tricarboxylate transporter substrate binding protein [Alphaproteobacteria bacterium]